MALFEEKRFDYTVRLTRTARGSWKGRADAPTDPTRHPGYIGAQPEIELSDGVVHLTCTESDESVWNNPLYRDLRLPVVRKAFRVGPLLEFAIADGDILQFGRGGAADLALTLFRGSALQVGVGAIVHRPLGQDILVQEDPRAPDLWLYGRTRYFDENNETILWLDTDDPARCDGMLAKIETLRGNLVIVIGGHDQQARIAMNHRVAGMHLGARGSTSLFDADGRFANKEEGLDFMRSLPEKRPDNLWVRFAIDGRDIVLREQEYACAAPWHLFVGNLDVWGTPGIPTHIAVARDCPGMTARMLAQATEIITPRYPNHEDERRAALTTIICSGETEVGRAALRAARDAGLCARGWCSPSGRSEDDAIRRQFGLRETDVERSPAAPDIPGSQHTHWNIRDADATVIFGEGCSYRYERVPFVADLSSDPHAVKRLAMWLNWRSVKTLHVAGLRGTTVPGLGDRVYDILRKVFSSLEGSNCKRARVAD